MDASLPPIQYAITLFSDFPTVSSIVFLFLFILLAPGFIAVDPNQSYVLVLFGAYKGTLKDNGFFWVNPFFAKKKFSLRARNFNSEPIKVNDKLGNPIIYLVQQGGLYPRSF